MELLSALITGISIKTLILILIGLWIIVAIIKKLFKLGITILIIFALLYFIYPLVIH